MEKRKKRTMKRTRRMEVMAWMIRRIVLTAMMQRKKVAMKKESCRHNSLEITCFRCCYQSW